MNFDDTAKMAGQLASPAVALKFLPSSTKKETFMKQSLIVAALLATLCAPVWAINKCMGVDGKTVFQDTPCVGAGTTLDVRPASGHPPAAVQGEAQARVEKMKRDTTMAEAIRLEKPLVGMTLAQLQQAMGTATKVNANNYNGTLKNQMIYERPQETWYVYTLNDVVDSIQNRPGAPIGWATTHTAVQCPSPHEINNAITSASSITLSESERTERWRAIRVMQSCRK